MSVLRTAPWRRAPRLLLRHPAVLLAVAGTCALLAMAAASGPLFLSSVGAAALHGRVAEQPGGGPAPGQRLVTFGLVGAAGAVILLSRVLTALLPLLRRRTADAPAPLHLAVRRLAGLRSATAAVLVATAVPIAILGYAGAITRSTDASVLAKARTYAGTEHAEVVNATPAQTLPVGDAGTQVSVVRDVETVAGAETQVLGVDPATFLRFAYADPAVFGSSLPDLVRRLDRPGVPAVAVRCPQCGPRVRMTLGRSTLTATVVGTADLFPGLRVQGAALLVVPRRALAGIDPYANRVEEVWTSTGRLPAAVAALERIGRPPIREVSPAQFLGSTQLRPVT